MNQYKIKYWLYKKDQWVITILVVLLTAVIILSLADILNSDNLISQIEFRAWVAIIAGLITLLFAFMKQKHNDMSVFFKLFEKYNSRYDEHNDFMNHVNNHTKDMKVSESIESPFEGLDGQYSTNLRKRLTDASTVKSGLDDYLNLCAEEYLAYSNGYIPPDIMQYWYNGMEIFFKNDHIREYFKKELESDSYYQFKEFALEKFREIEARDEA